jgi:actin-related protein
MTTVVIDQGSATTKAGLSGIDAPQAVFPTRVGRQRRRGLTAGLDKMAYVGNEAYARRKILTSKYPIECGICTNWDDMEHVWTYTFQTLDINPEDHSILLSEVPLNPKANREMTTQIMFETYNIIAFAFKVSSVLSLYASGRTTGIVVDVGADVTHVTPIYEGHSLMHYDNVTRMDFAGRQIEDYLLFSWEQRGCHVNRSDQHFMYDIKHKFCFVSQDFERDSKEMANHEQVFELPDRNVIVIGKERFIGPEILFQPDIISIGRQGVHEMVTRAVLENSCSELREDLYRNIVLAGGTTFIKGFQERFKRELTAQEPTVEFHVDAPSNRQHTTWIGGSLVWNYFSCYVYFKV